MDEENKRQDIYPATPPEENAVEQPAPEAAPGHPPGNKQMVADDEPAEPEVETPDSKPSRLGRFKNWYGSHKKWTIPATIILVIALLAAIPWSRYKAAGLVMTQNFSVEVLDSTTDSPVSGASVRIGNLSTLTDGNGQATLNNVPVGSRSVSITKKHYKDHGFHLLVPITKEAPKAKINLVATGRQVNITVNHYITDQPLSDVDIKISDVEAKTNKDGTALVVLPADASSQEASLSLEGYNTAAVKVSVNGKTDDDPNVFKLVPAGKVYFLSRLSGKIDVVKTNLDGSERKTVLAGTGREENSGTVLLASRDWKYLAMLSKRDSLRPSLYLIETATDKLTEIDSGDADFSMAGWSGDHFIYTTTRRSLQDWESKKIVLKSYNPVTKQLILLDQNDAAGDEEGYAREVFGSVYSHGDTVVYHKEWYAYGNYYYDEQALAGKVSGLYSIKNNGKDSKNVRTVEAKDVSYIETTADKPGQVFMTVAQVDGPTLYVEYNSGGVQASSADDLPGDDFRTYLLSPSGEETFWSEERDGKNTLLIGDSSGNNGKAIATLSEYETYGWFGNEYLLVSKNSSELYIMPKSGKDQKPKKISDYHKPTLNYFGYGGI